jgi:dTDP-4-dehydrorhamnose reductase
MPALKRQGEKAVQGAAGPHYIVRTSWLFSPFGHNFVKTMLRLAQQRLSFRTKSANVRSQPPTISVVADQFGCPTSALDLARCFNLTDSYKGFSLWHTSLQQYRPCPLGSVGWRVFEQRNLPITVKPISTEDFAAPAPRPHFSVLENTLDPKARHWKEALAETLSILKTA